MKTTTKQLNFQLTSEQAYEKMLNYLKSSAYDMFKHHEALDLNQNLKARRHFRDHNKWWNKARTIGELLGIGVLEISKIHRQYYDRVEAQ